jgi:hypothetical protein
VSMSPSLSKGVLAAWPGSGSACCGQYWAGDALAIGPFILSLSADAHLRPSPTSRLPACLPDIRKAVARSRCVSPVCIQVSSFRTNSTCWGTSYEATGRRTLWLIPGVSTAPSGGGCRWDGYICTQCAGSTTDHLCAQSVSGTETLERLPAD